MQTPLSIALAPFAESICENGTCYILLHEQDGEYLSENVSGIMGIYSLEDLVVSLREGLDRFGYEKLPEKPIEFEKLEDERVLLDVPFKDKTFADQQGVTRFILYPIKRASESIHF